MQAAGIEQFKLFTADFGAQLQRLKQKSGDCLFIWGAADTSSSIVKHLDDLGAAYVDTPTARGVGWHPQLFGWAAGLGERKWVELAGDAARVGTAHDVEPRRAHRAADVPDPGLDAASTSTACRRAARKRPRTATGRCCRP